MDNIDIFNNSAIILERKVPIKIVSWITILIMLSIIFIILSFVNFNIYQKYSALYLNNKLIVYGDAFPHNNKLYIENKKYKYEILSIDNNKIILDIDLDENLKVNNSIITINVLKDRTNIFSIIKRKWKDVLFK